MRTLALVYGIIALSFGCDAVAGNGPLWFTVIMALTGGVLVAFSQERKP
jgi:RsiW-degrading membrane proteinase PrsW (M82 family)